MAVGLATAVLAMLGVVELVIVVGVVQMVVDTDFVAQLEFAGKLVHKPVEVGIWDSGRSILC